MILNLHLSFVSAPKSGLVAGKNPDLPPMTVLLANTKAANRAEGLSRLLGTFKFRGIANPKRFRSNGRSAV